MYAQQRTFLINARNYAYRKSDPENIEEVTDIDIKLNRIDGLSEAVRNRVAEELSAQGLIEAERNNREVICSFKLTPKGLLALEEGLKSAGSYIPPLSFQINEQFVEAIYQLIGEIQESNTENKQVWLELSDLLKEEIRRDNPRKNVLGLLLGTISKGVSFSANTATVLSAAGININEIVNFAGNLIR